MLTAFLDRAPQRERGTHGMGHHVLSCGLPRGDVDAFLARLRAEHETSAVPGRFFEMPECFRIGMGVNSEMFAEGLRRVEEALLVFLQPEIPVLHLHRRADVHLHADQALGHAMGRVVIDHAAHQVAVEDVDQHVAANDQVV